MVNARHIGPSESPQTCGCGIRAHPRAATNFARSGELFQFLPHHPEVTSSPKQYILRPSWRCRLPTPTQDGVRHGNRHGSNVLPRASNGSHAIRLQPFGEPSISLEIASRGLGLGHGGIDAVRHQIPRQAGGQTAMRDSIGWSRNNDAGLVHASTASRPPLTVGARSRGPPVGTTRPCPPYPCKRLDNGRLQPLLLAPARLLMNRAAAASTRSRHGITHVCPLTRCFLRFHLQHSPLPASPLNAIDRPEWPAYMALRT